MECLDYALEYTEQKSACSAYPVIIVAAGSSSRMEGTDKMTAVIAGRPVVVHTVSAFAESDRICELVVVTRPERIEEFGKLLSVCGISKPLSIVAGGDSREESVYNGIKALGNKYEKVLIHDGARPLVSQKVICNVCDELSHRDSVTCGVKMKDTVKVVNEDMEVIKTLCRDFLSSIQTPQGVSVKLFLKSAENNDLSAFTDDTSVVEAVGARTRIVDGDYRNIKITTPDDILLAEAYLKHRGEEQK